MSAYARYIDRERRANNRFSYRTGTARRCVSQNIVSCCTTEQEIAYEKACNR